MEDNPRVGFVVTEGWLSAMEIAWSITVPVCQECGEPLRVGQEARWDLRRNEMTETGEETVHVACRPYMPAKKTG